MPDSIRPVPNRRFRPSIRPILLSIALFALNAYICRELFAIGFIHNLDSNEGVFVSISRFFRDFGFFERWYPWFNAGMPIANAYQPLLPALAAITGKLSGWPVERAFHSVLATAYCLGPVALFLFALEWSRSTLLACTAGLAWSLLSPAELLIPALRLPSDGGHWGPLRLYNLVHYAEDPHNLALSLLPLALLFLHRTIVRKTWPNAVLAVIFCASVVLSNAFGAVDLAIGGICVVLALNKGLPTLFGVGLVAWLWISPWLPPSLIHQMRQDQWTARGVFNGGSRTAIGLIVLIAVSAAIWFVTRRLKAGFERFSILFALWMGAIPLGFFLFGLTLVPQASRYQLELEIGSSLAIACICARVLKHFGRPGVLILAAVVLIAGVRQTKTYRHFARSLIQPLDITQTIQFKTDIWLDRHFPGQRTMVSGDTEFLYNILSNNPQMSGGHQPTAPNWMQKVAIYGIYTGSDGGPADAETSVLWLKAYGNHAVTVPGEKSREFYHPFAHPHKFDGILPVLWHDEDDTIFAVPGRSPSLAHVVPKDAIVTRAPVHGLDIAPLRPYVAALDDPNLPQADFRWLSLSRAEIRASLQPGQVLSIQVNYDPGWRARTEGLPVTVHKDALGLMVLDPGCAGPCEVHLAFGVTTEAWACRLLSGLVTVALLSSPLLTGFIRLRPREPSSPAVPA